VSIRALLKAVESRLRSAAVLDDAAGKYCGVQPDGRPPPGCGQLYYAVHHTGATDRREATTADQTDLSYAVSVTVTARLGVAPTDRLGAKVSTPGDLLDLAEALAEVGVVHGNYAQVLAGANALIPGTQEYSDASADDPPPGVTTNGFEEPLALAGIGQLVERPASWVRAERASEVWSVEVRFAGARRLRLAGG
jgi:hypothetical protein